MSTEKLLGQVSEGGSNRMGFPEVISDSTPEGI